VLWLLIVVLACASTIVLSLDTTAVLLTPVAVTVARQVGVPPLPFAMTTSWLANTASLLLSISNLTDLLALHQLNRLVVDQLSYLRLAWAPATAAIVTTVVVLAVRHRAALSGEYVLDAAPEPRDRPLLLMAAGCRVLLGPAFVSGLLPAIPASIAAALLLTATAVRDRSLLRRIRVPWLMVLGVMVPFVVVDEALSHGLRELLTELTGAGTSPTALFQLAAVGAVSANLWDCPTSTAPRSSPGRPAGAPPSSLRRAAANALATAASVRLSALTMGNPRCGPATGWRMKWLNLTAIPPRVSSGEGDQDHRLGRGLR
jgi:arsenical pump membrane protein